MKRQIILIAHDIRSCHNVGSLLRTADGLGVRKIYLTGYTPYPAMSGDSRLPHLAIKIDRQIAKTALGAEKSVAWEQADDVERVLLALRADGYEIAALEQAASSIKLPSYKPPAKIALIVGSEVGGVNQGLLAMADLNLEIPMLGQKESFNVATAAGIALYHLRYS